MERLAQVIDKEDSTFTLENAINGLEGLALANENLLNRAQFGQKVAQKLEGEVQNMTANQIIDVA